MASAQRIEQIARQKSVLPHVMLSRNEISIWSILKHSIGKDLTRITMPIVFNEPLSFLQRLAEHMEYVDIIKQAAQCDDDTKRIMVENELEAIRKVNRVAKPFNPMLGETYELDRREDLGFHYVSEQVCHHPPISAYDARGDGWHYYGSCNPKLRFYGQSVEATPKGVQTLVLSKYDEVYTWHGPQCVVHNLVMGTMYIEHTGVIEVINHKNGLRAVITLKPGSGWFSSNPSHLEGYVIDKSKKKHAYLYGDWVEFVACCSPSNYEMHFNAWLKEHREKKRNDQQQRTAQQHSPPPSRRFSTIGTEDSTHGNEADRGGKVLTSKPLQRRHSCISSRIAGQQRYSVHTSLPLLAGSELLWRALLRPPTADQYYHFSMFGLMLNEWNEAEHKNLPPTDSRRRPDIRFMDEGDIDNASDEKYRLEEKQRAAAADRKKSRENWHPTWFRAAEHKYVKGEEVWLFDEEYHKHDWDRCPDIYEK